MLRLVSQSGYFVLGKRYAFAGIDTGFTFVYFLSCCFLIEGLAMVSAASKATELRLDRDIYERVARLAETQKCKPHVLMCEAIREYVEREEHRASFHKEAMASWEDHMKTGLHVTGDEVIAWLKTWGSDHESAAPTCHR